MKRFKSRRRGGAYAVFDQSEARLVANLAAQVAELLGEGTPDVDHAGQDPLEAMLNLDGPVDAPDDPVLQRLLPVGYRDDDEAAAEFRRFTERGLREAKIANARLVIATLRDGGMAPADDADDSVEVDLDAAGVQAWLRTLTDIRLALATRLDVDDDEHHWDHDPDDPAAVMHDVYDWLGFVQETLVQAIDR
ncbi:MAG: DUF2017 domain-containing protein [Actinomycetota bacterium]|nr:DUF2017 domain-containing protein [Actinomycetota bacterium]